MPSDFAQMYRSDEYLSKHPDMFSLDSPWKADQAWRYIEHAVLRLNKPAISLLDAGGGAGEILRLVSRRISDRLGVKVIQYSLDLSPAILDMQRKANPHIFCSLNEDIAHTSLNDKEIDLTLLLDVLEHLTAPATALREVRRISHWALFKVPLEDNIYFNLLNLIHRGEFRCRLAQSLGHINIYNSLTLRRQVAANAGPILMSGYTNAYKQFLRSPAYHLRAFHRILNHIAALLYRLSPALCARIFNDFIMLLVNCDSPLMDAYSI